MTTKNLFIIDGHHLAYRAYFALPTSMKTKEGLHTNAIFGFASMLLRILQDNNPDYFVVTFDKKAPTFRHIMYPEYKAHRPSPDQEFIEQIPYIKEVVEAFNLSIFEMEGFEADDLMGTIAKLAEKEDIHTTIVTGDRDTLQLITDKVSIMTPKKGLQETVIFNTDEVKDKYSLTPIQIIDMKALMGDKSDNIPGVPGIGEKTAIKLLTQYNTLENVINNVEQIKPPGVQSKIKNNIESARLSYELATIKTDIPLEINFNQLKTNITWETLREFFTKLQFVSLVNKLPKGEVSEDNILPSGPVQISGDYKVIKNNKELSHLVSQLQKVDEFAFDIETTSLDTIQTDIVGISFCWSEGVAAYIPFPAIEATEPVQQGLFGMVEETVKSKPNQMDKTTIIAELNKIFSNPNNTKIAHNIKFDMSVLKNHGVQINGFLFDTMIADYLIEPTRNHHNLKFLAEYYFNLKMTNLTDLIGKGKNQITLNEVPTQEVADYCCADSDATLRLNNLLKTKLNEMNLRELYRTIEEPTIRTLIEMEQNGIALDIEYLKELSCEIDSLIEETQKNIFILAGEEFNINSTQQLSNILFTKLCIPAVKKTKTGMSTNMEVLEILSKDFEIASHIIKYRQYTKLKSTYVDALPELIKKKTGKLHTTFNQTITATGRLSSTNPNLQNIPVKTELGSKIRQAFIPSGENMVLLSIDYSQMELRIMAELSQDELLLKAFLNGEDIHTSTASVLFEVDKEDVSADMRRKAKTINFGIIYGMSAKGLADSLNISIKEGKEFIDNYFAKYTGIKAFLDKTIHDATQTSIIANKYGRIRSMTDLKSSNHLKREAAKRIATNTPIQGTASDIMKIKMNDIYKIIQNLPFHVKILLQVHDELIFEVDKSKVNEFSTVLKTEMENIDGFKVPFTTSISYGNNWKEAK